MTQVLTPSGAAQAAPEGPLSSRSAPHRRRRIGWFGVFMQAPSLIVLALVIAIPLGYSLVLSFQSYSPVLPNATGQWIGLANYARMFTDVQFGHAILVTVGFAALAVTLETLIGMALGSFLATLNRSRRLVTSILLVPMIATPLVVGLMFGFAFNSEFGYLSPVLEALHIAPAGGVLTNPTGAFFALVATDVWEWVPFIALMVMAGLSAIPDGPVEAARIDGANQWQLHWRVKFPMIRGVLGVAILFRATEAIREFDKVFVLTGGGPGSSTTVSDLYQYRVSFTNWDLSYGATLGIASFVVILILSAITFRVLMGVRKEQ